jgi:hypothetical protein
VTRLSKLRQGYEQTLQIAQEPTWLGKWTAFAELLSERISLLATLQSQAMLLEQQGDYSGVLTCINEMKKLARPSWHGWVESAAMLSRCLRLIQNDKTISTGERTQRVREYGQLALGMLRAIESREMQKSLENPDFDPLRAAFPQEFRQLRQRAVAECSQHDAGG